MNDHSQLLTVPQLAAWLNVSTDWVTAHASRRARPSLPVVRFSKKVMRFDVAEIERWITEQKAFHDQRKGRAA